MWREGKPLTLLVGMQTSTATMDNSVEIHLKKKKNGNRIAISSVQSLSRDQLFAIPWTAACQASLSFTLPWSLLKLTSTESVMPSKHLIICRPLLLLPSVFPSIRIFSNELALHIRWPKYWSFSFCPFKSLPPRKYTDTS